MKKNNLGWIFLSMLVISITSCNKEGCTDSNASNYDEKAKKDNGKCNLPVQDSRTKFLGSYYMNDSIFVNGVFNSTREYVMTITTNNTKKDTIYLNNLANFGQSNPALVAGNHFSLLNVNIVHAIGSISGNNLTYLIEDNSVTYKGKGTKQ